MDKIRHYGLWLIIFFAQGCQFVNMFFSLISTPTMRKNIKTHTFRMSGFSQILISATGLYVILAKKDCYILVLKNKVINNIQVNPNMEELVKDNSSWRSMLFHMDLYKTIVKFHRKEFQCESVKDLIAEKATCSFQMTVQLKL